ncbi:MAG: hypothetical protein L6Q92_08990 [Phycisphaerae bacterium]|nr:hypothetical protein [Phycisphaerae bacterium]
MPSHARCSFVLLVLCSTAALRADLIELSDGRRDVGLAREQRGQVQVFDAQNPAAPRVTYRATEVARIVRADDEITAIDAIRTSMELGDLAERYYASGLELLAGRCLTRALTLDPELGNMVRVTGGPGLRQFWNRTVLVHREAKVDKRELGSLVALARWSREAGLNEDAARLLRRAGEIDANNAELIALAKEWKVSLEPFATIDLTPALHQNLFLDSLNDERVTIRPAADCRFVIVPFRFACSSEGEVRRATFEVKAVPSVRCRMLGFLVLEHRGERVELPSGASTTIFERLSVTIEPGGRSRLTGVNTVGPARGEGDANKSEIRRERLGCSGWAALVLEVDRGAKSLRIAAESSEPQSIGLSFFEDIAAEIADPGDPGSPGVARLMRLVTDASPAVAMLAIQRLSQVRRELVPEALERWAPRVDRVLREAMASPHRTVQRAAWDGMVRLRRMTESSRRRLWSLDDAVRARLLPWIGGTLNDPLASEDARANAIDVLDAVLRSSDERLCAAAIELLADGAPAGAYDVLGRASPTARRMARERFDSLTSPTVRESFARALVLGSTPAEADRTASLVRQAEVVVRDPADPLLRGVEEAQSDEERAHRLLSLTSVSLVPVLRSNAVAAIFTSALSAEVNSPVRAAAARLALDQSVRRVCDASGSFPLRWPKDDADPLLGFLKDVTRRGPAALRAAAVLSIVREGDVLGADECVRGLFKKPADAITFVNTLCEQPLAASCDGLAALLARMAALADEQTAAALFSQLDALAARPAAVGERLNLAIKAGVDWSSLAALSVSANPDLARSAGRWAERLGHFSPQDATQFRAASELTERDNVLREIGFRRGRLVDGTYAAFVVVGWTAPVSDPNDAARPIWRPPIRTLLPAGEVELRADATGRTFRVLRGSNRIGHGTAQFFLQPPQTPEEWLPELELAPPPFIIGGRIQADTGSMSTPILRSRTAGAGDQSGMMRLDAAELIRAALLNADPPLSIAPTPETAPVGLQHVGFGTWAGTAARFVGAPPMPTTAPESAPPVITNCAVLLERRIETPTRVASPEPRPSTPR